VAVGVGSGVAVAGGGDVGVGLTSMVFAGVLRLWVATSVVDVQPAAAKSIAPSAINHIVARIIAGDRLRSPVVRLVFGMATILEGFSLLAMIKIIACQNEPSMKQK
jgi:hypothetical protein